MSKRRRRSGSTQRHGRDAFRSSLTPSLPRDDFDHFFDAFTFARPDPRPGVFHPEPELLADLAAIEDRRRWNPDPVEPPRRLAQGFGRIRVLPAPRSASQRPISGLRAGLYDPPPRLAFQQPQTVAVCVRRERRREVLHALKVAGARGLRPPRRSPFSDVSCKRRK